MPWRVWKLELIWFAVTLLTLALTPLGTDYAWILGLLPAALCALFALGVIALRGVRLVRAPAPLAKRRLLLFVALALATLCLASPLLRLGRLAFEGVRFRFARPRLQRIVDHFEQQRSGPAPATSEGAYIVEPGPPLRIAFVWTGMLDNWCGPVYDPSGSVMRVNAFRADWSNWDDPALAPIKQLFGGDMRSCRKLDGPYYLCCFT